MSKHDENMFGSAAWDTFNNDYDNSGIKENFGPEIESDKIEVVNTPVSELKSSAQTLLRLDIDKSGSMSGFTTAMNEALGRVKESIVTSTEVNRIQIAKTLFAGLVECISWIPKCQRKCEQETSFRYWEIMILNS